MASSDINLTLKDKGRGDSPFSLMLAFTLSYTYNNEKQFISILTALIVIE